MPSLPTSDRHKRPESATVSGHPVERSPEKAGVGGSIPSLATMFSVVYRPSKIQFHSVSFQKLGLLRLASWMKLGVRIVL
jgi:hypothetical protein